MRWLVLVLSLVALPVSAQDAFPLAAATIVNSPDVTGWPQTAVLTDVVFDGSSTRVEFTKHHGNDRWPDITPEGWKGPLQYTLWLFVNINGQWVGSGFIQFWENRPASGSPSDWDVPSLYDKNWFYAARWAPIYGHGPIRPGEQIGFMVTSGNARDSVGPYGPSERSNVVVFSAADNAHYTFSAAPPPPVVIPPVIVTPPPPIVTPPPVVVTPPSSDPLLAQAVELLKQQLAIEQDTNAKVTEIHAQVRTFWQQFGTVMTWVGKYGGPFIGGIAATWWAMHNPEQPAAAVVK